MHSHLQGIGTKPRANEILNTYINHLLVGELGLPAGSPLGAENLWFPLFVYEKYDLIIR